ncbi:hypothetical protein HOP50_09g54030 [Chloropicon primus]|uniref:Uncharacterized protein n=1 Tax=Chloropicon primus TaxID=1764295 RepID=A0A5B8MT98_9CHLO|nr:hypothetical protein A3770_09p53730 [Chloropicon primus]UPR02079.1 hypothetical protein HOP50_09g54030 [Chloropicon primus]|eukprot:QDZ22855.1 hypothetical protein A3770_09p53730 [Chloropicon primus]
MRTTRARRGVLGRAEGCYGRESRGVTSRGWRRGGRKACARAAGDEDRNGASEVVGETAAEEAVTKGFVEDRALQEQMAKKKLLKMKEEEEIKKGQRTAIITGTISILLGVAWLAIVFLLDSRGNTLEPPPPEAFL